MQSLIKVVMLALVVNGLKVVANTTGHHLTGWPSAIAAVLAAIVIFSINRLLGLVVLINLW